MHSLGALEPSGFELSPNDVLYLFAPYEHTEQQKTTTVTVEREQIIKTLCHDLIAVHSINSTLGRQAHPHGLEYFYFSHSVPPANAR